MNKEKRSLRILIVEDNPGDLLLIEDFFFEKIAFPHIEVARSFYEVKQLFEQGHKAFDAILLDLSLPDKSGESLLEEVLPLVDNTPVIVLTGYTDIEFGIKSLSMGVSDYLLKDELTAISLYKSIVYSIERKEITNDLKESEKRYKELFHLSPEPMWLLDMETRTFLDVNQAAIKHYGYSKEEFLKMTAGDIIADEDIMSLKDGDRNSEKYDKMFSKNISVHEKKGGEIIKVEIQSNIIRYQGGNAEIVLANDITERLNYIFEIEEKNERLQEIAWIQSHVVRAPLARLMGLVYAINESPHDEQYKNKFYQLILKSADELDDIIRDIADKADKISVKKEDPKAK